MQIPLEKIQWIEFYEHPISLSKDSKGELFEIHSIGFNSSKKQSHHFNHPLYCKLLLEKVLQFNVRVLYHFLEHQCNLMTRPYVWLAYLNLLLQKNIDLLIELNLGFPLNDSLHVVNEKKTEHKKVPRFYLEVNFMGEHPYCFESVKLQLDKIENYREKKIFLLRMKTDYLQNQFSYDGMDFGEQIDLELDALEKKIQRRDYSIIFLGRLTEKVNLN